MRIPNSYHVVKACAWPERKAVKPNQAYFTHPFATVDGVYAFAGHFMVRLPVEWGTDDLPGYLPLDFFDWMEASAQQGHRMIDIDLSKPSAVRLHETEGTESVSWARPAYPVVLPPAEADPKLAHFDKPSNWQVAFSNLYYGRTPLPSAEHGGCVFYLKPQELGPLWRLLSGISSEPVESVLIDRILSPKLGEQERRHTPVLRLRVPVADYDSRPVAEVVVSVAA